MPGESLPVGCAPAAPCLLKLGLTPLSLGQDVVSRFRTEAPSFSGEPSGHGPNALSQRGLKLAPIPFAVNM